ITREEKFSFLAVPNRDGEFSDQMLEHFRTEFLEQMERDFRVRPGSEDMPSFQPATQILVVIDLTVHRHEHVAGLIPNRLLAARNIDNGEPTKNERKGPVLIKLFVIRPPMRDLPAHRLQDFQTCLGRSLAP